MTNSLLEQEETLCDPKALRKCQIRPQAEALSLAKIDMVIVGDHKNHFSRRIDQMRTTRASSWGRSANMLTLSVLEAKRTVKIAPQTSGTISTV